MDLLTKPLKINIFNILVFFKIIPQKLMNSFLSNNYQTKDIF